MNTKPKKMRTTEIKPDQDYRESQADPIERIELNLTEKQETDLANWIDQQRTGIEQDRSKFFDRQKKYLSNWDDFVTFSRKGPWENSCFLDGTDLLTERGWIPVQKVNTNDRCLSINSRTGNAEFANVLATQHFSRSSGAVRLKSSNLDITVTANHRILLVDNRGGRYENRRKFVLAETLVNKKTLHWGIPRAAQPNRKIYSNVTPQGISPELWFEFMGWYISEGSPCSGSGGSWVQISQSKKANPDKHGRIKSLLSMMPFRFTERDLWFNVKVGHELYRYLDMGGCFKKYVPREMFAAEPKYLSILLGALIAGDGYIEKKGNGHRVYTTSSPQLASDVQELMVLIGRWGRTWQERQKKSTAPNYRVSEHTGKLSDLPRMLITSEPYDGPSYCVSTTNGTVYARMNGTSLFIGQSQLHMPLTAIKVKSYHSRLYNIFTNEDTTQLVPRESMDERHVEFLKILRNWYLWDYLNGYSGVRDFAREAFYDCVTVGYGIGMKDWQVLMRKMIEIEPNELSKEMQDLRPKVEEAKQAVPQDGLQTEEEMAQTKVEVRPYKEVQKILTVFEGTRLQSVPFENAFFPNFIPGSSNLDFPPIVVIQTEMSMSDIQLRAKRGEWDPDKVEKVKNLGDRTFEGTAAQEMKQRRDLLSGYHDSHTWNLSKKRIIEYAFCSYDIDEDDINEELVVTKSAGVILKVNFLDRISPSGMRPLFKFDCFSKPRQAYSRGVPEYLYPLNEEMDQHHNMRIDYLSLQTCPFGVYRGSSSLKNEPIQISPGKFIPVDDITDMRVMNFPTNATALNSEEDRSWHYADLLTSTSSLSQGIVPQQVGPTRSTSGVVALLRQMDKEFIVTVDQCAQQWKKLEKMVLDDLDFRISPAIKMRVLGASIEAALGLPPEMSQKLAINAQFDMSIDVARVVTSDEVQRNDNEMILNKISAPSVLQQSGIIGPKALYRALSEWLRSYGKDDRLYLDKPEFITKPLTLFQEIQVCQQGDLPAMSMQDNHEQKAAFLVAFTKSPEYLEGKMKGLYSPHTDEVIYAAAKKHLTLAEMLQPKGLPNPTGANEANMTQNQAGESPQQGGPNPNQTTSRDLAPPPEPAPTEPNAGQPTA